MSQKLIPTLIGIFVVGAVVLAVLGVMFFGGGEAFAETVPAVMYFGGSLAGLDVGAPVMFQGVTLGSVTDIVLTYYTEDHRTEIPVFIELRPDRVRNVGPEVTAPRGTGLQYLIREEGLRGRLATESFVTGKLAIQLDFHPDTEIVVRAPDDTLLEIPTIPSMREELEKIEINKLVEDFGNAVRGFEELVRDPELKEAIRSVRVTVDDFGKLARNIDGEVQPLSQSVKTATEGIDSLVRSPDIKEAIRSFDATVDDIGVLARNIDSEVVPLSSSVQEAFARASAALKTVDTVIAQDSPLHYQITRALKEISEAAESVGDVTDLLQRHPEALIHGKQ